MRTSAASTSPHPSRHRHKTRPSSHRDKTQPMPKGRAPLLRKLVQLGTGLLLALLLLACHPALTSLRLMLSLPQCSLLLAVSLWLVGVSLLTFMLYAVDKSAAKQQQWRVNESTLHLYSLLGGWPGAWLARRLLRHKSVKTSFIWRFWLCVAANLSGLAAAHYYGLLS